MKKMLSQILPSFKHSAVSIDGTVLIADDEIKNIPVTSLVFDSRDVTDGSLFFALPGTHVDGNNFIPVAIEKGANVVVFQGELSADVQMAAAKAVAARAIDGLAKSSGMPVVPAFLKVEDSRFAMSPISDAFFDYPSRRLVVIGVTGTEGKSSTVSFIWQLLRAAGKKAGFISTVDYSLGGEAIPNPEHQTTPEAPIIQEKLNAMLENGCSYAVVESSSHGLSVRTNRLGNVLFDCAVFMNVTLEHLEFHKTFEQYRDDKANLFRALDKHSHVKFIAGNETKINSIGIVNLEDESAEFFIKATKHKVFGFTTDGLAGKSAAETGEAAKPLPQIPDGMSYMRARNIAAARFGLSFALDANCRDAVVRATDDVALPKEHTVLQATSQVSGAFNAYNIMASLLAVSSVTDLAFEELVPLAQNLVPVKGRMTVVDSGQPFEVIVDYAHTPSSFETIFPPIRKRCGGRIFAVFGSGGERDLTKRPLQGEIAAKFCDVVVLADEDPRGEDPTELLKMIAVGAEKLGKKEGVDLFIIPDRKKAIRHVFKMANAGDIVLLLGKSHENSIIYKDYKIDWDEIGEAKLALSELGGN